MPRTRQRDDTEQLSSGSWGTDCDGNPYQNTAVGRGVYTGRFEKTVDTVTSKYSSRSKKGEIINNPFKSIKIDHGYQVGTWKWQVTGSCSGTAPKTQSAAAIYGTGNAGELDLLAAPYDSLAQELAQTTAIVGTRALAGVVSPEVQGLVDLAEWRKTIALVKHPVNSLNGFFDKLKKSGKLKKGQTIGQFLSENWLAYRYGVTPLALSLQGALVASSGARRSLRHTSRSSGTTSTHIVNGTKPYTGNMWDTTLNLTSEVSGTVRAGVLYEHEWTIGQEFGLSISQIPATIWELIPYSFIADWFVNVGDYIEAITPKESVRILAKWTTVKTEAREHASYLGTWSGPAGYSEVIAPSGEFYREITELSRSPGINASITSKHKTINFDVPADWLHLTDSFALMLSKLGYR